MMASKIREDKELLSSITSDLKDLGITDYPREDVIQKIHDGEKIVLIEGTQPYEEANQTKGIDYSVILKQAFQAGLYMPVSLFVRVAEEPHRSRIFKLSEGEFFTLPQAVNLLHDRPVAKKEFINRKIEENWYSLDSTKTDVFGNSALIRQHISEPKLIKSLEQLPIKPYFPSIDELISKLKEGDAVPVTLLHSGMEKQIFVKIYPAESKIVESSPSNAKQQLAKGDRRKSGRKSF